MKRILRLPFVIALSAAATGCTIPAGSSAFPTPAAPTQTFASLSTEAQAQTLTPTGEIHPTEGPFLPETPNPMLVEPELDAERAVTAVIPIEGGVITAEAADGSVFTLTIPPDALLSEQAVTLTPLTGVSGQELSGGFVAGVELAPDGLALYATAQLSIIPAQPLSPAEELSFAVHGEDNEAFLYPLLPQRGAAVFAINHFSAYYLGAGDESDVQAQQQSPPTSVEDQLMQQISDLINGKRGAQLVGEPGDPDYEKQVAAYLLDYWRKVLVPHIEQARVSQDWRFICKVIDEVLGFARTLQIAGVELDIEFDYLAIIQELLRIEGGLLLEYTYELCEDDRLLPAWTILLRVVRSLQMFETNIDIDIGKWQTFCPPPRLSFSSRITSFLYWTPDLPWQMSDVSAQSDVQLTYDPTVSGFRGSAPVALTVLAAQSMNGYQGDGGVSQWCVVSWAPEASTLMVKKLVVNLNRTECKTSRDAETTFTRPDLELLLNTGKPIENYSEDCSQQRAASGLPIQERDPVDGPQLWSLVFPRLHEDSKVEEDYKFTGWSFSADGSTAFLAFEIQKDFNQFWGALEKTLIELRK